MTRRRIARRIPAAGAVLVTYRHEPGAWYVSRPNRAGALRRMTATPFRSYGAALVEAHRLARSERHPQPLRPGPAVPDRDAWHGSTIDPARHWRTNTTAPCAHRHRTRPAALACSALMAARHP